MAEDMTAWLRAQLDEDEKSETSYYRMRDDIDGYWCPTCGRDSKSTHHSSRTTDVEFDCGHRITSEQYRDRYLIPKEPNARAMAEIAAKRAIVDAHHDDASAFCPVCCNEALYGEEFRSPYLSPCPTLRHLAAVYADRPGYEEEWRR